MVESTIFDEVCATVAALETALSGVPGIRVMRVDGEEQVQTALQALPVVFVVGAAEATKDPIRVGSPSQGLVRSIEVLMAGRDPDNAPTNGDLYTLMKLCDAALLGYKVRGVTSVSQMSKGPAKRLQILNQGQLWQRAWSYWIPGSEV